MGFGDGRIIDVDGGGRRADRPINVLTPALRSTATSRGVHAGLDYGVVTFVSINVPMVAGRARVVVAVPATSEMGRPVSKVATGAHPVARGMGILLLHVVSRLASM